jgi:hypothetical protein
MSRAVPILALSLALALPWAGCIPKTLLPDPYDDDTAGDDDDTRPADDDTTGPTDDDDVADDDTTPDEICHYLDIVPDADGSLAGLVSLAGMVQPNLDTSCDCHQTGNESLSDLSPGHTWGEWVEQPSRFDSGEVLVVPGDPEGSVVMWKLLDCYSLFPHAGGPMPPNAPPMTLEEVTMYYNWMLQGAANN